MECELTADLVDSCVPGDMVTITAVVKATGSEEGTLQYRLASLMLAGRANMQNVLLLQLVEPDLLRTSVCSYST